MLQRSLTALERTDWNLYRTWPWGWQVWRSHNWHESYEILVENAADMMQELLQVEALSANDQSVGRPLCLQTHFNSGPGALNPSLLM